MNNYHIYEEIGRGKYSIVYKGRKKKVIEYVAVKSIEKQRRKKVLNEVKIFNKMNHPNILKFYNWYETKNHLWIIFEYCAGGDLMQLIEQDKSLPENVVKSFGQDLVCGLQYLHSRGIIYCDLKPSNILLNEYGTLKLSDFGLARQIVDMIKTDTVCITGGPGNGGLGLGDNSDANNNANNLAGCKKGTPFYMAPELFEDDGVHSYQSDMWALGCILYELATGKPPFVSTSFAELVNLIVKAETPRIEKFSEEFNDLLHKLLEKDPLQRADWNVLIQHPFWKNCNQGLACSGFAAYQCQGNSNALYSTLQSVPIPAQPHFENWVKSRMQQNNNQVVLPQQSPIQQQKPQLLPQQIGGGLLAQQQLQPQTPIPGQKEINTLRLSLQIQKNMQKEDQQGYNLNKENNNAKKDQDIKLANRDQEVDFGEHDEDEQEEDYINDDDQQGNNSGSGNGSGQELEENTDIKVDQLQQLQQKHVQVQQPQLQQQQQMTPVASNNQKVNKEKRPGEKGMGNFRETPLNLADDLGGNSFLSQNSNNGNNSALLKMAMDTPSRALIGEGNQTPVSKVKQIPLEQLFTHNTDNAVKPIIGNRDIERCVDVQYQPDILPFENYKAEEVINGIDTPAIEQHFEQIYSALVAPTSQNQQQLLQQNNSNAAQDPKLNILNYFETIIQHSNVSNRLINSQFMNLLLKMLKNVKTFNLKTRLCSIVGLLIRHATVIDAELSQLGIPATMIDQFKIEKNEKAKRKAIATLGEYLFYGATQMDEDPTNTVWEMPQIAYQAILKILKTPNEDEVVKFYAAKTVENITAQSVSTGTKFANSDVAGGLISLYFSTKNENLKICSIVCLTHMTVLNNSLIEFILDKFGGNLVQILLDAHQRIQQAFQTIINMHILNSGSLPKAFGEDREFFGAVVQLLESPNVVIRGKAVLMLLLMIKISPRTLIILAEGKFYNILDRLVRDNYKYVQQCLFHLLELLDEMIPHILKIVSDELARGKKQISDTATDQFAVEDWHNNGGTNNSGSSNNNIARLRGNLNFLVVLLQYLRCTTLCPKIFNHNYLEILFAFLDFFEIDTNAQQQQQQQQLQMQDDRNSSEGGQISNQISDADQQQLLQNRNNNSTASIMSEAKIMLFTIYEAIITNQKYVLNNCDFFIKILMPKLAKLVLSSQQVDMRFNSLKLFIDVLNQILNEPTLYEVTDPKKPQLASTNTRLVNDFLLKSIIPNLKRLLTDSDPIPFWALKLLNLLLEKNSPTFMPAAIKVKLVQEIFGYFTLDHPRLTKNTLRIICICVYSHELSWDELTPLQIVIKTVSVFKQHSIQQLDWAYGDLLDILLAFSQRLLETLLFYIQQSKSNGNQVAIINPETSQLPCFLPVETSASLAIALQKAGGGFETVLDIYDLIFNLLSNADYNVSEKSASLLIYLIYIYGNQLKIKDQLVSVDKFVEALSGINNVVQGGSASRVKKQLKALWWALSLSDKKIKLQGDKCDKFVALIDQCMKQEDKLVIQYAKELIKWVA